MSFHLGVVGGFELPRLKPKVNADTGGDQQEQEEDDECAAAAASDGRLGWHWAKRSTEAAGDVVVVAHGLNSAEQSGKVGFGLAHGAG